MPLRPPDPLPSRGSRCGLVDHHVCPPIRLPPQQHLARLASSLPSAAYCETVKCGRCGLPLWKPEWHSPGARLEIGRVARVAAGQPANIIAGSRTGPRHHPPETKRCHTEDCGPYSYSYGTAEAADVRFLPRTAGVMTAVPGVGVKESGTSALARVPHTVTPVFCRLARFVYPSARDRCLPLLAPSLESTVGIATIYRIPLLGGSDRQWVLAVVPLGPVPLGRTFSCIALYLPLPL